jgi:DNA-binding NtrC family response regulator
MTAWVIGETGRRAVVARSAEEARSALADRFDVALVDWFVPGGGEDLVAEIAERVPRVVVVTGATPGVVAEIREGGVEVLRKPFGVEGLIAVLG